MRIGFNEHIAGPKLTFGSGNESYLSGSFRSHAKRSQKTAHRVWQSKPDALRWHLFAAPVFDSDWFQESSRERCSVGPTQQPLHRGRTVVGDHLSADSRSRTDRDLAPVASQWSVSIPEWSDALSECHYAETISVAHRPQALPRLRRLHDRFLVQMSVRPRRPRRLIFDLDSTALIVYGRQEAADVGIHPFKPGSGSYHL